MKGRKGRRRAEKLTELVCRKLAKGKTPERIEEELEEEISGVERICEVAAKYAPDYDVEKIWKEAMESLRK